MKSLNLNRNSIKSINPKSSISSTNHFSNGASRFKSLNSTAKSIGSSKFNFPASAHQFDSKFKKPSSLTNKFSTLKSSSFKPTSNSSFKPTSVVGTNRAIKPFASSNLKSSTYQPKLTSSFNHSRNPLNASSRFATSKAETLANKNRFQSGKPSSLSNKFTRGASNRVSRHYTSPYLHSEAQEVDLASSLPTKRVSASRNLGSAREAYHHNLETREQPRENYINKSIPSKNQAVDEPVDLSNLPVLAMQALHDGVKESNSETKESKFYHIFGNCNLEYMAENIYKLSFEVAGYKKEDMKIILNPDNTLIIFGELKYENKDKYIHIGLLPKFYKSFLLSQNAEILNAKIEMGILSIQIKNLSENNKNSEAITIT